MIKDILAGKVKLYTPQEVAAALRVEPQTIYKWIKSRKIHAVQLADKTLRIPEDELDRLVTLR